MVCVHSFGSHQMNICMHVCVCVYEWHDSSVCSMYVFVLLCVRSVYFYSIRGRDREMILADVVIEQFRLE